MKEKQEKHWSDKEPDKIITLNYRYKQYPNERILLHKELKYKTPCGLGVKIFINPFGECILIKVEKEVV